MHDLALVESTSLQSALKTISSSEPIDINCFAYSFEYALKLSSANST